MKNNRANKSNLSHQLSLYEEMDIEKKKRQIRVCNCPKTYKFIPIDATEEEEKQYIAMHYDEKGKFIMQPAGDYNVFGGQINRE